MVLIKAGVWHTTVWADRTWQTDLWLEYGTSTPPRIPPKLGMYPARRRRLRRPNPFISELRLNRELAKALIDFFELD